MSEINSFVITGASSDLGTALARYLDTRAGAELILVSRSNRLPSLRGSHLQLTGLDLTDQGALQILRERISERFHAPFAVVHCVGDFWEHKPLIRMNFSEVVSMMSSHYLTLCGVAWAILPLLVERGGGRLVALSCNSVTYNYPDMAPFTSAKAAVESFIKCIANEYSEFNIIANSLALPTVLTDKVLKLKKVLDCEHYVHPDDVSRIIVETLVGASPVLNGNTIKIFKHSPAFFNQGYFERNPREISLLPDPSEPKSQPLGEIPGINPDQQVAR